MPNNQSLDQAIYNTVRYFNLFDQPVTTTQIWRLLIISAGESHFRWSGHHVYSLRDIREALIESVWLNGRISKKWGYYFLNGQEKLVELRILRHRLAQAKWKTTRWISQLLIKAPFVRMLAMSGSLSAGNTKPSSDLDIFVIARHGRIWTVRLCLLILTQLIGRRRKYWNRKAPDKICLNHYISDDALAVSLDIRNIYTAILYQQLIPLYGLSVYEDFEKANSSWTRRFLMYPVGVVLPFVHEVKNSNWIEYLKRQMERFLLEPVGDWVEKWAESFQRWTIARHAEKNQSGRIVLSGVELAFHPDTKVPGILERFAQDEGQKKLW